MKGKSKAKVSKESLSKVQETDSCCSEESKTERSRCSYIKTDSAQCKYKQLADSKYCKMHKFMTDHPEMKRETTSKHRELMVKASANKKMLLKFWETRYALPKITESIYDKHLVIPQITNFIADPEKFRVIVRTDEENNNYPQAVMTGGLRTETGKTLPILQYGRDNDNPNGISDKEFSNRLTRAYLNHYRPTPKFVADIQDARDAIQTGEFREAEISVVKPSTIIWTDTATNKAYTLVNWYVLSDADDLRLNAQTSPKTK